MQRYKLTIEYDGTGYFGFQRQPSIAGKTIEEVLEKAIYQLSQQEVKMQASGRTDAGVHALGQVIHFDLEKVFSPYQMVMGLNSYLRAERVVVLNCELVDENFHARFNSTMRHYRYRIINRRAPLAIDQNRAWHFAIDLDLAKMKEGAQYLIGSHDFSAFRDSDCQAASPIRTINSLTIDRYGEEIIIEVSAKSFLHHMVRNIVGTLAWVGSGKILPSEIEKILLSKDRTQSGPNALAGGLYFLKVEYD